MAMTWLPRGISRHSKPATATSGERERRGPRLHRTGSPQQQQQQQHKKKRQQQQHKKKRQQQHKKKKKNKKKKQKKQGH
jgi:hypothetical protein